MMITNHNSDKVLVVLTKYYGFIIDRISNSHFQLNYPGGRRVTIPRHNRIKLGVIKSISTQVHSTQEEFLKHFDKCSVMSRVHLILCLFYSVLNTLLQCPQSIHETAVICSAEID
jgi:predicted RNA binding protein YcfA (HicA-like mRNA interferase family)